MFKNRSAVKKIFVKQLQFLWSFRHLAILGMNRKNDWPSHLFEKQTDQWCHRERRSDNDTFRKILNYSWKKYSFMMSLELIIMFI